jgi:O-antigen/teichoic acid export membrane protein
LKDTLIYGTVDFFFKFINFSLFPLYAFVLPISDFGILALLTTLTQLLCIVMNCGQTYALQRFYREDRSHNVTKTGFICFAAIGVIVTLTAFIISYWQTEIKLSYSLVLLGILAAWPYQVFQYSLATMRVTFLPWKFASLNAFQNVFSIGLSLILALYCKLGLLGFLSAVAIANFTTAGYCLLKVNKRMEGTFDRRLAKQMLIFGLPFIFTDLTNWLYASLDRWMLSELANSVEVGYYSIAFKLSTVIIFFINAFSLAWNPHAMKLYHEDPDYKTFISKGLTRWFFFLTCLASMLILFNKEVLMLTTPSAYWPASQLIPLISVGLAFHGTLVLSTTGLFIEKKTHYLTAGTLLCAVINFVLNLKLIPHFGAYGAAFACMLTYIIQSIYYIYCSQKFHFILLEYKKLCACATLLFGVLIFSQVMNFESLVLEVCVKGLLFVGVFLSGFMFKLISYSEIKVTVQNLLNKSERIFKHAEQ